MGLSLKGIMRGAGRLAKSPLGGIAARFIPGLGQISTAMTIAGAIGGLRRKRPGTPPIVPPQQQSPATMLDDATVKASGQAFGDYGLQGLKDFDPEKSFNTYLGGAEERFRGALKRGVSDITGASVGSGRLDSGYLDLDVGDFGRQLASDFRADAASKALTTAGMVGDKYRSISGIEEGRTDRSLDLLSGQADRKMALENAKRERKSNRTNAIVGAIGTIGGAALGNWLGRR